MLIIGIAGGTGSGKTTVVRKIIESLPAGQTAVIPQDSYYWDSSHIPVEERQNINFDEPAAIDFDLLVKHLKELKAGHSIEQPIYSFLTCTRSNETITVEPRDIVIVEGILILCNEEPPKHDGYESIRRCRCRRPTYQSHQSGYYRTRTYGRDGYRTLRTGFETDASATYRTYKTICRHHYPPRRTQLGGHRNHDQFYFPQT